MKLDSKEYQYAVVNFLQRPRDDIDTYKDAKYYILEKKYGVAADDLCTSVNKRNIPIKRPQLSESQFEVNMSELKVVEVTNEGCRNIIPAENSSSVPNKNQTFVYPYLQKIPDYCKDNSPDNDCEDIEKSSCISRDLLNSMKQHLLGSQQSINQNQVPAEKISEESSVAEPPQLSLDDKTSQDSDMQPMVVDETEVTKDTEVSLGQDDDSVRSSSPGVITEEIDQPIDYPIDKIRIQANFIANLLETMETSHLHSSERILEVHKSFERSIELVKLIKDSYNSKKLELNKEKQPEVETHDAEMKSDDVKNSSSDDEDDDSENEEDEAPKKSPKSLRNFVLPPDYDPKDTRWTLKYRENDPDLGLVELVPESKVFVNAIKLAHCKRVSKDCKTLARMLLAEIFSQSALAVCSLTGAKANAFHNNGTYVRPGLDANARTTMLAYVEDYAREKQWAAYDKQRVINSIRSRVQEIRSKHARK